MRRLGIVCALSVGLSWGGAAGAQPGDDAFTKSAARSLAQEGDALFERGEYAQALDRFDRARSLVEAPTLDVRRARTLVKLGRLLQAESEYVQIATRELPAEAPSAFREAIAEAREELRDLQARIPSVVIERAAGVGPVRLDGRAVTDALLGVKVPVNPGELEVEADGAAPIRITIAEGETRSIRLELAQSEDTAAPPNGDGSRSNGRVHRIGAVAAFGVGALGLGLGVGFGAVAIAKKDDLDEVCDADTGDCPLASQSDIDDFETVGALSTIGFLIAAAGAGTGTILLLTAPSAEDQAGPTLRLIAGPSWGGLSGTF